MKKHEDSIQITMDDFTREDNPGSPARASERSAGGGRPTPQQWAELYEVARNIRQLAPWDFLWESNLITIMLPGREEPVYCSIMGRGGECYALGIYPGYKSIHSFYRLAESSEEGLPFVLGFEQDCLACHFGDREEVTPEDREIYKALGLRFRGRNEGIYINRSKLLYSRAYTHIV